jgi:redox-sensitive bicupin YhaK (pirin superfamily)
VQRMSAGTGIVHSEYNASREAPVHLLQIWIVPERRGLAPGYEQKHFPEAEKRGRLRLVASPEGRDGSVTIHQDARLYAVLLDGAERAVHRPAPGRRAYMHVARGRVTVNGQLLKAGDALKAKDVDEIVLDQGEGAEVLVFDLA